MNIKSELEKMAEIDKARRFLHDGIEYTVNEAKTLALRDNKLCKGKPLKKYVGEDANGNTKTFWSHDCKVVSMDDEPIPTPHLSPSPKPKKKKKKLK